MKGNIQLQLEEAGFDYDKPDPEAQLSWDLWKKQYETARDSLPFLVEGYPSDKMKRMQSRTPTFKKMVSGKIVSGRKRLRTAQRRRR